MTRWEKSSNWLDLLVLITAIICFFGGVVYMCKKGHMSEAMAIYGGIMILFCKIEYEFKRNSIKK